MPIDAKNRLAFAMQQIDIEWPMVRGKMVPAGLAEGCGMVSSGKLYFDNGAKVIILSYCNSAFIPTVNL
jgi:hypothetical protein